MSKIARNDPCLCGSGLKFKKCCDSKGSAVSSIAKKQIGTSLQSLSEINVSKLGGRFFQAGKSMKDSSEKEEGKI